MLSAAFAVRIRPISEAELFERVDFIAKLAALVPKPRVNLSRFHGVFAPNSLHRVWVTPARRGKGSPNLAADQDEKTPAQRHVAMTWDYRSWQVVQLASWPLGIDIVITTLHARHLAHQAGLARKE